MAKRHTDWPNPEHRGELNLAKQLCSFADGRLHLWFDLNTLLGVNDIDVLLYHELLGLFVIEVKALPIEGIEVFGWKRCHIRGREPDRGPQYQALKAMFSLLGILSPQVRQKIHPTVTVCWPKVERRVWNRSWDVSIDDTGLDDSDDFFFADAQQDLVVREYRRLIQNELESLTEKQRPLDLLILVPNEGSNQRKWAVDALGQIGCPFLDYTVEDNRRSIPQEEMIRLCTFHSSRGIEGHRVLVLGFEVVEPLSKKVNVSVNNLGYIVLSRASIDLTLAYRAAMSSQAVTFVRRSLVEIYKSMNSPR